MAMRVLIQRLPADGRRLDTAPRPPCQAPACNGSGRPLQACLAATKSRISRAVTRSGWRLNGRPPGNRRQGIMPGSRCLRSFGSFGPFLAALSCTGPKRGFAPERTATVEGKAPHAALRACVPGAPGHFAGPGRGPDEGIHHGDRGRRRKGRQDRVLGRQDHRLQDQEEPQGPLFAPEHRRAAGRGGRDGAAHGPVDRRHPLHHRPRRRARDRAIHPDAQERPRRSRRSRPRRVPRRWRRPWRLPWRRSRRLPRRRWRR